ncbi:MAG TPA: HEAT repeat domain-containing protein [Planctomycetota bacterium]|nr:HEAT repeat domain-containing protein [Planctomycetota bacterium]
MTNDAVDSLVAAVVRQSPERPGAIEKLLALPEERLAEVLEKLASSKKPESGAALLEILARAPDLPCVLETWRALAQSEDREARSDALLAAARLSNERALPVLRLWLQDPDALLRVRALRRLRLTQSEAAAEAAVSAKNDPDASMRREVVKILEEIRHPAAVETLSELARDADEGCRASALEVLYRLSPFDSLLAAIALQRERPADAGIDALVVLSRLQPSEMVKVIREGIGRSSATLSPDDFAALLLRAPDDFVEELRTQREAPEWLRAALIECDRHAHGGDPDAVLRLSAACSDSAVSLRLRALNALACHHDHVRGGTLWPMLRHDCPQVRRAALLALAARGSSALRAVTKALADDDAEVRLAAYESWALLEPESEIGCWRKALDDDESEIRETALERLLALPASARVNEALAHAARNGEQAAVLALLQREALPKALAGVARDALAAAVAGGKIDRPPADVVAMVKAVAAHYPNGALEALISAAKCDSAVVRRAAAQELFRMNRRIMLAAAAELSDTEDSDVLKRVAQVFAKSRDPRGLIAVIRAHDECPGAAKEMHAALQRFPETRDVRFLIRALKMRYPSVKRYAARALMELDSPEMIEPLLQATKDDDPEVQQAAMNALAKFAQRPEVYARLIEIRDTPGDAKLKEGAVGALLGMGDTSVVQPLLEATHDEDVEVRLASVQALGKFATRPEVYQRLIEMLEYGDIAVREKCIETLGDNQIRQAVEPLIRLLNNPFLKFRVQEALMRIGDRKGYLAIKRAKIREKMFGKKKAKGPVVPVMRKGRGARGAGKAKR